MMRAIISDLDGVLMDSEKTKGLFWKEILGDYDVPDGEKWYAIHKGAPGPVLAARAVNEFRIKANPDLLTAKNRELHLTKLGDAEPIPNTIYFLKHLPKEVKLAVASSMYVSLIQKFVKQLGLEKRVEEIASGADEVAHDKPAPDVYQLAAKRLGVLPSECIVIEDSLSGVKAAKAAGMYCVGYAQQGSSLPADIIISDFSGLSFADVCARLEK